MSDFATNHRNDDEIDLTSLFGALWRRKWRVIFFALLGLGLAVLFLFLVKPTYESNTQLLIEKRETVFTRPNDERNIPQANDFDALSLASQVEVLQSRGILKAVADKLKLGTKAEFDPLLSDPNGGGVVSTLMSLLGFATGGGASETREERVLKSLSERVTVYGVNDSRVVSVEVVTREPTLSAEIANAITNEYLQVQRDDSRTNTEGASLFLEKEISQLRERVAISERKVEDFRSSADLIAVDDDSTLTKQQLSETLTLLSDVNAERTEAEAKADQILRLLNSGAALDSSSDVQDSPLIQRLREQQVSLRARIVDLQTSLLASHPQVKAAQSQLADLDREIARQARLIARALEGDAKVAKVRQQELEREITRLKTATSRANEQEIKLRALEREANAQRELLETYLTRFRESTARQNSELLPVNARVISAASVPFNVHFPKPVPTLAVATFAGAFLASLFILAGELLTGRAMVTVNGQVDPSFNDLAAEEFVAKTNEESLSHEVPEQADERGDVELTGIMAEAKRKNETLNERVVEPETSFEDETSLSEDQSVEADGHDDMLDYVAQKQSTQLRQKVRRRPKSAGRQVKSTSDLYSVAQAIDAIDKYQLENIVVLPVFQNRSCADFALQLARSISASGHGVAFVDTGDAGLTGDASLAGISDVINEDVNLDEAVFADPMSDVDLIMSGTSELFIDDWEEGHVQEVVQELSENYDVTVLHDPMGVTVPYFDELVEHADMIVFATNAPLTRKQVAAMLRENIDTVPAHSMFVAIGSDSGAVAA
ncbi:MAG: exopolysaccharide transport family protein [Hyphomicrobiales bacterium]